MKKILILCFLSFFLPITTYAATVARIVDGDSIRLRSGEKIRFYGVNSPEMNTYAGKKAKAYLESILPRNARVQLIRISKDQHGRTLAIVLYKGKILQELMLKKKHAWVFKRYCKLMICKEWERYR